MGTYAMVAALEFGYTYSRYTVLQLSKDETYTDIHTDTPLKPLTEKRIRTCILLNENKKFEEFGYAAEEKYLEYVKNGQAEKCYLFRQFLSTLHTKKKIDIKMALKDVNGKPIPAWIVIEEFIMAFIKDLTNQLNKSLNDSYNITSEKIKWVITVPTDFTDDIEHLKKVITDKVELHRNHLTIVTKLETTFAYCQKFLERDQYSELEDSTEIMVVDFQDCDVDIRVVQKKSHLMIEKYYRSLSIYEKCLHLLKEIVNSLLNDVPSASLERRLNEAYELAVEKGRIGVGSFIQFCKDTTFEGFIEWSLIESVHGGDITIEDIDTLLDDDTFKVFKPTIDVVIFQMETVFKVNKEACKVKFIALTWDFVDSDKKAIGLKFPQKRIILPKSNDEAVMNGAVLYGNQPYRFITEAPRIIAEGSKFAAIVALHFGRTYCGYAFSFQTEPSESQIESKWIYDKIECSEKTSSLVCLDDNKAYFGYEAEKFYANNFNQTDGNRHHLLRPIEKLLFDEKNITTGWKLLSNGKEFQGKRVFKTFIKFLIERSMEEIRRQRNDITFENTRWVITVPVGRTNNAGIFMKWCTSLIFRKKMKTKKIQKQLEKYEHQQLLIVSEAEATFAYCQKFLESDQYSKLEESTEFMIVALGGYVADVRIVKKVSDLIVEMYRRRSDDYSNISAKHEMMNVLDDDPEESQDDLDFSTELDIERILEEAKSNPLSYQDVLRNFLTKQSKNIDDEKMYSKFFKPTVNAVITELETVFQEYKDAKKVHFIVLTGDFFECCLLTHAVGIKFPQKRVIFSDSDEAAVMKGAVLFGQQPFQYTLKSLRVYEKRIDQKGLLLVINYTEFPDKDKDRKGSEEDVEKLRSFFLLLNYDVLCYSNLSTDDLERELDTVKDSYLTKNSQKYHCFICVIMSHGNDGFISTSDSTIKIDTVVRPFKNDEATSFIGKPKIFMIQTCRGEKRQKKTEFTGPLGGEENDNLPIRMPKESDILKIYATPPGYVSSREPTSPKWKGAWLIQAFLCVAKQYPKSHILELLTAVNYELACNPEYEGIEGKCQVSVSESALSKLFYL